MNVTSLERDVRILSRRATAMLLLGAFGAMLALIAAFFLPLAPAWYELVLKGGGWMSLAVILNRHLGIFDLYPQGHAG